MQGVCSLLTSTQHYLEGLASLGPATLADGTAQHVGDPQSAEQQLSRGRSRRQSHEAYLTAVKANDYTAALELLHQHFDSHAGIHPPHFLIARHLLSSILHETGALPAWTVHLLTCELRC